MPKSKKQRKNIEWIVSGRVTFRGATSIVHAPTRELALEAANNGQFIGGVETETAEMTDWDFSSAAPNVEG